MRLFDKRPLSLVLCIMLGGFVLFTRGNILFKWLTIFSAALLLGLFIFSAFKKHKKPILLVCSIGLCFSILFSYIYFGLWFNASERFKEEVTVEGTVQQELKATSYYRKYVIKANNVDTKPFSGYKLILYVDQEAADSITVGSGIRFKGRIENFKDEYAHYSYAKGFSGYCQNTTELEVTDTDRFVPEAICSHIREVIARHAKMLSDADTGGMVAALLLGERDMLSEQVQLDFKRLGITHLLALSGLHLAILSFALEKILRLLGAKSNVRTVTTTLFTLLYMALTGFPVSVMRAGFMLILSNLLTLMLRDSDSVTSLFIATSLICFITPYAIYDISLWLSAFATLGIIVFSELSAEIKLKRKIKNKLLSEILLGLSISAFAICATLFITQFSFKGFSLISPLATLIFGIFVELIMYLGGAMFIIGWLIPIGLLLSPIVKITTKTAAFMSSFDIYVSKEYQFISILVIILSLIFFVFIVMDIKKKKAVMFTVLGLLSAIYLSCGVLHLLQRYDDSIFYHSAAKQDVFVIKSDSESTLISSSQYTSSTGYNLVDIIESHDLYSLDNYIASHLSWKISEELEVLLSYISVKSIYLPSPQNEDEKAILNIISTAVKDYRTEIRLFSSQDSLSFGDCKVRMLYTVPYGEDTSQNIFMIYTGTKRIAYLSSGVLSNKKLGVTQEVLTQTTDVIFGNHGKNYKSRTYFKAEHKMLKNIIVSSNNLTVPANTAYYYIKNGCKIHSHPNEFVLYD